MNKKIANKTKGREHTLITKMTNTEAKGFFREANHYVNFDLPPYFNFDDILLYASTSLMKKKLSDVCRKDNRGKHRYPGNYSDVNYTILSNKDGGFAWRPMQIIHPILYMDLVNIITEEGAWNEITDFFKKRDKSKVECISIPLRSHTNESNRAVQVTNWWDRIEQESLRKALDYKFMFQTDISNCYSSIYTHSFEWAMCPEGRIKVKEELANGRKVKNLGSEIDFRVRQMNQNQTIGIPQGSVLMDFLAEIVLGAIDLELTDIIEKELHGTKFAILRYRDDYRIFVNEYQAGHSIMKILNTTLYKWGMKMNTGKTSETSDIITASIKVEKMKEIYIAPIRLSYQKAAMRIYMLSKKYPNTGLIAKSLTDFFDQIQKKKVLKYVDYEVVVAIITMIAFYSPKYMPQVASIVSLLIEKSGKTLDRKRVLNKIVDKFANIPNTEFIDVWLQRIADTDDIREHNFNSPITLVAVRKKNNSVLWNSDWLYKKTRDLINSAEISKLQEEIINGEFSPLVDRKEFELYRSVYPEG
jgi:hypothetical protein